MTLRFKQGEIARLLFITCDCPTCNATRQYVGQEVTVDAVGPWPSGSQVMFAGHVFIALDSFDYIVNVAPDRWVCCRDYQLAKLGNPDEGETVEESEQLDETIEA